MYCLKHGSTEEKPSPLIHQSTRHRTEMETTSWSHAAILFLVAIIWSLGSRTDLIVFSLFTLLRNQHAISSVLSQHINLATVTDILKLTLLPLTLLQIYRYLIAPDSPSDHSNEFPLEPMLFPCRTTHTRLIPKKHSFSYSYLLVGIPVGWKGSIGGMISSDVEPTSTPWYRSMLLFQPGRAWYSVNGDDYLARGHVEGGLREKLDGFLLSQVLLNQITHSFISLNSLGRVSI